MKFKEYNHATLEPEILKYWQKHKIVDKLRKRNKKGKKFYFLDGPPYTSGKFHLAHAWNYAFKDIMLRYKRMHGFNVWDRNGFDVHGLPTEHKVMAKFGLNTKDDIHKFGVDKFVTECQKFCLEMAAIMTKDLIRMGVTVNTEDPYMALKTEFIEGEWALLKKAHQTNRLYLGKKSMTWCANCETALAKHELEYKNVKDKSIYVKFPIKGKKNEFLIIWTTTPWTIAYNLAVMVNPKMDYVRVKVGNQVWILAKALVEPVIKGIADKSFTIVDEFKGKVLDGLQYIHPFHKTLQKTYDEISADSKRAFTVVLSTDHVDVTSGTGLVHCAPGCGPEDFAVGQQYKIPPFNNITEDGYYPETMGEFSGYHAKKDNDNFIEALNERGVLVATRKVDHEYPHCWRCRKPVIFKTTDQWFFKVEDLRKNILDQNKKVHWVPDTALHSYESWIENLRDNSISRQRFWGTPLPIWTCNSCEAVEVIGSTQELKDKGAKVPKNIHLPWIDKVLLDCECGNKMKRIPDVIDVWVDAGTASWNCLYTNKENNNENIKQWYPADFIMEAKEQTRLWFSMLSICSHIYLGKNAFKNVYVYGMLNDIEGKKMSKSIGNIISPYELIDKHGVDVLRYYMCQNNAGQDINFSWDECVVKQRQLHILWNLHKLLINLAKENDVNPFTIKSTSNDVEEDYIISKLNTTIKDVTEKFDNYLLDQTIAPLEGLFLDLSRTYIQIVREKSSIGTKQQKKACIKTIATVLLNQLKMFQIISPFVSEAIYLNLKHEFKLPASSISHFEWPSHDQKKINRTLEGQMSIAQEIIQATLHAREKARLGLRWPASEIVVVTKEKVVSDAVKALQSIILKQTNTKDVRVVNHLPELQVTIKPNFKTLGPAFGKLSPKVIAALRGEDSQTFLNMQDSFPLKVGKKTVSITKDMFTVENEVPPHFSEGSFKQGFVYLSVKLTPDLEAEGYSREVMRHIQNIRKEAGLQKWDKIHLTLEGSESLQQILALHLDTIKTKVGASKLEFSSPSYAHSKKCSVKKEHFVVSLEKA